MIGDERTLARAPALPGSARVPAAARAVYANQVSLIQFFMHHHEWSWHMVRRDDPLGQFRVWTLASGGRQLRVCRDGSH